MTQLGEAVAMFITETNMAKEDNYCEGVAHDPQQTGPNVIDGLTGMPTPDNLLSNIKKHKERADNGKPAADLLVEAFVPDLPGDGPPWDISKCNRTTYPWQTHHLIPKKFLPTQPVCTWLTAKYTKHPEYQLAADTKYSTDHANNGYCLPFASTTKRWKAGDAEAKTKAAEDLMARTARQLHQGNHSKQVFDEDEDAELRGYLDATERLLKRIYNSGFRHVKSCQKCCQKNGKRKIQPLHRIVRQVDIASLILKLGIDANKIFVSQRAYNCWKDKQ